MRKLFIKFGALAVLFFTVVIIFMAGAHNYRRAGFVNVRDSKGNTWRLFLKNLGAVDALAQQPPGGPAAGAGAMPQPGQITGQTGITAGTGLIQVPAAGWSPAIYSKCFVQLSGNSTPVASNLSSCLVTSTAVATVIGGATVTPTIGALAIVLAGTATATVNWQLSQ